MQQFSEVLDRFKLTATTVVGHRQHDPRVLYDVHVRSVQEMSIRHHKVLLGVTCAVEDCVVLLEDCTSWVRVAYPEVIDLIQHVNVGLLVHRAFDDNQKGRASPLYACPYHHPTTPGSLRKYVAR